MTRRSGAGPSAGEPSAERRLQPVLPTEPRPTRPRGGAVPPPAHATLQPGAPAGRDSAGERQICRVKLRGWGSFGPL